MQLIGDTLAVLGARHGISFEPQKKRAYLVGRGAHKSFPFRLRCGIEREGKRKYLPLTEEAESSGFDFYDQKIGICCYELTGISKEDGLILRLRAEIPFCPGEEDFSSVPVLLLRLEAENMRGNFRWENRKEDTVSGSLFLEADERAFETDTQGDRICLRYSAPYGIGAEERREETQDVWQVLRGRAEGNCVRTDFSLRQGERSSDLSIAWCAYAKAHFSYRGEECDFRYKRRFASLDEVARYAAEQEEQIRRNSVLQDRFFLKEENGVALNRLLCWTLHSFLMNTWFTDCKGRPIFTVWEGNCYFHSTVDVEFTQSPFYYRFFPKLLEYELEEWRDFFEDGARVTGKEDNSLHVPHDIGSGVRCDGQAYPHPMEVEETANYLIMRYLLYRSTGRKGVAAAHAEETYRLLRFLAGCTDGESGMVERGVCNSMDDASPALQYGRKQTYLGIKAAYALAYGAELLKLSGRDADEFSDLSKKIFGYVEEHCFRGDHFIVAADDRFDGLTDSWTGKPMTGKIEGCDAYHIYAENTCGVAVSAGEESKLDARRARADILSAYAATVQTYGCRHTSYLPQAAGAVREGLAGNSPRCGWISMNMLRDIAAKHFGIDLRRNFEKYWEWQTTSNAEELHMFFETFSGNNLHFYPRGIALFGWLEISETQNKEA